MIRFLIKIAVIYGLWLAIDMESESVFASTLAPLAFGLSLITWTLWVLLKMVDKELSQKGRNSTGSGTGGSLQSHGGSCDSDGSGGGDGGVSRHFRQGFHS